MDKRKEQLGTIAGFGLAGFILAILLFYTFVRFLDYPYLGFRPDTTGYVVRIYVNNNSMQPLQLGDRLVEIDGLRWDEFKADLRKPIVINHVEPGQILNLKIERNGILKDISWTFPGENASELFHLIVSEFWLAYAFWLAGLLTLIHMRPKDERWRLMMAFNYLTAVWIIVSGYTSFYHLHESAIVLHMAVWFCIPVYLHLNWVFPKSFSQLPRWVLWSGYILAAVFALAEWFQVIPSNFYYIGFLLAVAGSMILLLLHAVLQPEVRRDLRILITAVMIAFFPLVIFGIVSVFGVDTIILGGFAILSLSLFPFSYFYASYRRILGNLEMRVNLLISAWLFLILMSLFLIPLSIWINTSIDKPEIILLANIGIIFFAIIGTMLGFVPFQTFARKHLMGIQFVPDQLLETYSARIITSTSSSTLYELIKNDLIPSLLVREFVFLQFSDNGTFKVLFATGLTEEQLPEKADIIEFVTTVGKYRPLNILPSGQPYSWVRLVLPLKVGDKLIGLWLLGRRDPDDLYPQMEIPMLQSLANQTAIAQSNILQTERIKALYLADIDRHEQERLNLALELHDSVLNQIAALKVSLNVPLPYGFQDNYERLTQQVREIASNLRPPMLNYGLKLAIEGLVDNLMDRTKDTVNITMEIDEHSERYPENIELHLYRILQEACENALRHAKARNIHISGRLDFHTVILKVEDDGMGFQVGEGFDLGNLLANKHFGLVGMLERAELIGAKFSIHSVPNAGTQIRVDWAYQSDNLK